MKEANVSKKAKLRQLYKKADIYFEIFNNYRLFNRSAELAYYLIIGLLTMLVTLVYSAHFIPNLIQSVDERILALLPDNIKDLILEALIQIKIPQSISVIAATSIMSIWFASRAMHSLMISFNVLYDIRKLKIGIKSKALSIAFTLVLLIVFMLLFALTLVQTSVSQFASQYLDISLLQNVADSNLRLLISSGTLIIIFTLLYRYLPSRHVRWIGSVPGAIFATIAWLAMSRGFTYYVTNLNNFSWILGSFGSIFVFLIWIYYCSMFILLGALFNSILLKAIERSNEKKIENE